MELLLVAVLAAVLGAIAAWAAVAGLVGRRVGSASEPPEPPAVDVAGLLTPLLEQSRALLVAERERATTELDGKKSLIDQQLVAMTGELDKVANLVRGLDADRRKESGACG